MLSRSSREQFSRSRTVKMPFSSRQLVVRTVRPISAVLKSNRPASDCARPSAAFKGMRVRAIYFLRGGVFIMSHSGHPRESVSPEEEKYSDSVQGAKCFGPTNKRQ